MTGVNAPARGGTPARAAAGAARRADGRLPSARRCLRPRASSSRRGAAGIALLLLAALAALPSPAQAQNVLVSNIGDRSGNSRNEIFAQPFRTGDHAQGYVLSSVGIRTNTTRGAIDTFRVRILEDSNGNPGSTVIATLTGPAAGIIRVITDFTATANTTLAANTTYYVEAAQTDGTGGFNSVTTSSNAEDSGAASGWSIGNHRYWRNSESDSWIFSPSSTRIRISGFAVNSAGDYTPPRRRSEDPVEVLEDGTRIALRFDSALDTANLPPASAFEVEADGRRFPVVVSAPTANGTVVHLDVSPAIRRDQTVSVAYEDPTPGDDAAAIQDAAGNDAADFSRTALNSSTHQLHGFWLDCPTTEVSEGDAVVVYLKHTYGRGSIVFGAWFHTDPGTATAPGDYVAQNNRAQWSSDSEVQAASMAVTVSTTEDTLKEGSETFTIRFTPTDSVRDRNDPQIDETCELTILDDGDTDNVAATGEPVVSGTARSGQTVTADTSGIADANGLHNARFSYRWIRVDGSEESTVGTDSPTYTVVPEDVRKRIKVEVTFADDGGSAEGPLASDLVSVEDTPATGGPGITGSGRVGNTLTADTSDIADADGLANVEYRYHWIRVDGTAETIVGADEATYVPVTADLGREIKVRVGFFDDVGGVSGLTSAPVTIFRAAPPAVCPALPDLAGTDRVRLWSGTVTVGDVLLLDGRLLYGHGFTEGSLALGAAGGLSDKEFGIGGRAYTVRTGLVGGEALQLQLDRRLTDAEVATLALHVCGEIYAFSEASYSELVPQGSIATYRWGGIGLDWSGETTQTLHLSKTNSPATGAPGISGTRRVGETLRASTGDIADADGLSNAAFSYRWIRVDGATETAIADATASTYTLADADEGKRVKVAVAFNDDLFTDDLGFTEETRTSASVAVRAAGVQATCEAPPLGADETEIWTGEVTVGTVRFQGAPIAYGFAEALSPLPAAGALSDTDFETGYSSGAHTVRAGMASAGGSLVFGLDRRLTANGTDRVVLHVCGEAYAFGDASYDSATRRYTWSGAGLDWSSVASRTLRLRRPSDITPPEIVIARTLGEGGGLIILQFSEVLDHDNRPSASAFPVTADGRPLTVTVSSAESAGILIFLDVSPRLREGQTVTLTYTDPTPGDDARAVQDAAGNDAASFTAAVRNDSTYTGSGNPEITGTARVGETLTASPGNIDDAHGVATAVYGYQWIRRDGSERTDIPGAAAETYTLTDADEGKRIQVRASFVDDAGNAETRTSDRTGTVAVSATAPKITIAPDRAKATGRFDFIRYTVAREGPATDALTVTVRLEAPAGNDWEIDDDKRSHEVAFRAGEAEKTLLISLKTRRP